jgi:hypothetical protein
MSNKKIATLIGLTAGLTLSTLIAVDRVQAASLGKSFTIDSFYKDSELITRQDATITATETSQGRNKPKLITINNSLAASQGMAGDSDILGGYRDLYLTAATNGSGINAANNTDAVVNNGFLTWNNDSGVKSNLTVTWDGNDDPKTINTAGLGGLDITNNGKLNGLFVEIKDADLTAGSTAGIAFNVFDNSGAKYSLTRTLDRILTIDPLTGRTATDLNKPDNIKGLFFDFTQFENNGSFATIDTFKTIGALEMNLFSNNAGNDFQLSLIKSSFDPEKTKTPEPALSLLALGGLGFVGAKRKKK